MLTDPLTSAADEPADLPEFAEGDHNQRPGSAGEPAAAEGAGSDDLPVALVSALAEIERHVARSGWDQPARLFALVRTDELVRAEPSLAEHLSPGDDDALSSIEQEDFREGDDLEQTLERMQWSAAVSGCALMLERSFLPAGTKADLPPEPAAAAEAVAAHPEHQDIRVVVGVLRDGSSHGLARLRSQPDELLGGTDLVPGLTELLRRTLQ